MNLSTIDMTREEAEHALREWGDAAKREKCRPEDAAIAAGYAALAQGRQLIAMTPTIRAGGRDDLYRPRLGLAPVTADVIYLRHDRDGEVWFSVSHKPRDVFARDASPSRLLRFTDLLPPLSWEQTKGSPARFGYFGWQAMVPVVPPRFRSRGWRSCHVLFEAEWAAHNPPAPVDPALVQYLRGDLWIVRGTWDLTPLERAVLMERNAP